jgi:hypothetical protein
MAKYIIVRSNRLNAFSDKINSNNLKVINMFSTMNLPFTICEEILLKSRMRLPEYFYNPQLINVNANTIIVFDGHVRIDFLKWLKGKNPNRRIILWFWNTVEEIGDNLPLDKIPVGIELWSYSEYDCRNYGLKYNTTFYWDSYVTQNIASAKNDLYFIGKDKGRLSKIKEIEVLCSKLGLKYFFQVVRTHKYSLPKKEYCEQVRYDEVQKNIAEARAILDVKVSQTAGPSIRPLEAAFYKKKLVTDDKDAVSFKFYTRDNIFILGVDDVCELKKFIYSEYREVKKSDIEYYNVQNWLMRFE